MNEMAENTYREDVEISGHIIDSLILPKVLDCALAAGGRYQIQEIAIGQGREDASYSRITIIADSEQELTNILATIADHGAVPVDRQDCRLATADIAGAFPEGFYSSTNQRTEIRIDGDWVEVDQQEMDCGIEVDTATNLVRCIPMSEVVIGQHIVIGHAGVRVFPPERSSAGGGFEFMNSAVSTEKPKQVAIRRVAQQMQKARKNGKRIALVAGPAVIHTGSGPHFCELIRDGFVDLLLAGNALATHDIEQSLFGTSLGVHLERGDVVEAGHEHHLRAINRIRRAGGIRQAVDDGLLTSGIMFECIQQNIEFLLAGSIRDDGPLPEVVTDALEAQSKMRTLLEGVGFCLMIATTLHSVAVGNLLPAWVEVVCVDINPSTVIKLSDRGSFQTVGLVTDVEPFLRELLDALKGD